MALEITENTKHLYTIGQLYSCGCSKSKIWTNSIRDEKNLLNFIEGKSSKYYQGFCNDLFCGFCYGTLLPLKNGYVIPEYDVRFDLYGCVKCNNKIAINGHKKDPETPESTQKLIKWYVERKNKWENFVL